MLTNFLKSILITLLLFISIILVSFESKSAEEINVPTDELARDSVYPVFDDRISVKNRNVQDAETFDIGLFGGLAITEPVYNASKLGFSFNYHINEFHSIGLVFAQNTVGLSKDAIGIKDDFGLDFNRAPYPVNSVYADYNYKLYYGKLSVTKNGVINTSIYGSASVGMVKYIHKSYPAIAFGVGERFYLTNHFAIKADLKIFAHTAPIPFKSDALREGIDPIPTYESFSERMSFTTNLEFGINYLF